MPAGKRRLGLGRDPRAQVFVAAEIAALESAAERAEGRLNRLDALRAAAPAPAGSEAIEAEAAPRKRGPWPFGRKSDPQADRAKAILADLEAVMDGRPEASAARAAERTALPAGVSATPEPQIRRAAE
jgi:hypothetical protein